MTKPTARDNWNPVSGCEGKHRFDTYKQAADINQARRKGRNNNRRLVYHCPACHGYHLGHGSKLKPDTRQRTQRARDIEAAELEEMADE